jgi:nucleoside-diphosphate-sugar epimerase
VRNAVAGKPVHLNTGGDHPREWLYIEDAAEGIVLAFKKKKR